MGSEIVLNDWSPIFPTLHFAYVANSTWLVPLSKKLSNLITPVKFGPTWPHELIRIGFPVSMHRL